MKYCTFSLLILLLLPITVVGCKSNSELLPPPIVDSTDEPSSGDSDEPILVFKTGFGGTTAVVKRTEQHSNITGTDGTELGDWSILNNHPYFGSGQIVYEQGTPEQRLAEIVADPENPQNKVLRFRIKEQHITMAGTGERKARIQYDLQNKQAPLVGGI